MSEAKVPLRFQIFKGDELVREEVLSQDVIKVGKLASSHLRIDDETVSRMHAVIEIAGPDDISLIDLGSTRGTTVNGERITKTRLQSGDEVTFGDARVVVTFLAPAAEATPVPPPRGRAAAPAPGRFAPAPAFAEQAAPQAAYAPPAYSGPAGFAGGNASSAEVEVADGTRAVEVQTIYRGVVTTARVLANPGAKTTHGVGTSMVFAGIAVAAVALITFVATAMSVGAEKQAYEDWQTAGKEAKNFTWQHRSPAAP